MPFAAQRKSGSCLSAARERREHLEGLPDLPHDVWILAGGPRQLAGCVSACSRLRGLLALLEDHPCLQRSKRARPTRGGGCSEGL